ncbi:MAG: hypothetical protein J6S89_00675, partial [Paludibacteraceae bacterium]|nr:hypothetical protein [Paludibacteraceae bacterium]
KTEFWNLVNSGNKNKDDYTKLYKKYRNDHSLKNDEIIMYLKRITKDSQAFREFSGIQEEVRKKAKSINELK